jgi:Ammonium Transporter Family
MMGPLWQVREASAVQAGEPVPAHVDRVDIARLLVSAMLVFFMQAGFTALESGLVRSKNSINVAIQNFANFLVCAGSSGCSGSA